MLLKLMLIIRGVSLGVLRLKFAVVRAIRLVGKCSEANLVLSEFGVD